MIGKMVLPMLGGTPAVWNTCMVFFQAMLLAGYAYAHWLVRLSSPRRQALIHLAVLALPLLVLPFGLGDRTPPTEQTPILWLLGLLFLVAALPFFAVIAAGYAALRWGYVDRASVAGLNTFVFYIALPALLLDKVAAAPFESRWWVGRCTTRSMNRFLRSSATPV